MKRTMVAPLVCLLALLASSMVVTNVSALQFYLGMMEEKCLSEDVSKNELIVGDFVVTPGSRTHNDVIVRVTGPSNQILYQKEGTAEGKFAFTTNEIGEYKVCFSNMAMSQKTIKFSFKTGVNAKDYTTVAKKDNLKPLEVELRRLEDTTAAIHEELLYMREREEVMRNTNESTHSRVLWFSVLSMVILVSLSTAQIFYLKSYFRKRKLID
eukprot:TRINITY_DN516_c0_g1_i1.p2 TRINITY_DN516_c0_g1~~TRINITY_DN516_c0_g1_i1.p2  ORF type:complete len:223 (+),score=106.75 TRINITY_DN516_c0_g1_i1:39-671(+)